MTDKEIAYHINALIYSECYYIKNKTKKVDKVLKQIKKGLNKLPREIYMKVAKDSHEAFEATKKKVMNDERIEVEIHEMLMSLYNAVPKSARNIFYTDNTFSGMVNSFASTLNDDITDDHCFNGRKLAEAYLDELGVKRVSKLATRLAILKGNMTTEKGYAA